MRNNIFQEKSFAFALAIAKVCNLLKEENVPFHLINKLLRCGTSIGANVEEGIGGQTRKDFASKIYIAYKEARETHFWLRLLRDSAFIDPGKCDQLLSDLDEILKITGSILKTVYGRDRDVKNDG